MEDRISDHFTLDEVNHTNTELDNECPEVYAANVIRLAEDVLEPTRVIVGPLMVNSWYRSLAVNKAVGGEGKSAHLEGRAADVVPNGDVFSAFKKIVAGGMVPYDRIIHEKRNSQWIHIQVARDGEKPLGLALLGRPNENGVICYTRYEEG